MRRNTRHTGLMLVLGGLGLMLLGLLGCGGSNTSRGTEQSVSRLAIQLTTAEQLAGNRLLILRENGELVLAPASPDAFRPLARAQIRPRTVRAYPALADGFLFARNDDTLVCVDLRK